MKTNDNNSNDNNDSSNLSPYYIEGLQLPIINGTSNQNQEKLNVDHGPVLNKQETYTTEVY